MASSSQSTASKPTEHYSATQTDSTSFPPSTNRYK